MKTIMIFFFLFIVSLTIFSQSFELKINTADDEAFDSGIEDSNGDFILCGQIKNGEYDKNLDSSDGYLVKINSSGNILLSKRISCTKNYVFLARILEQQDGYFVFGTILPDSSSDKQIIVLKFDINLNEQWRKIYGRSDYDSEFIQSIIQDSSGKIIGIGYSNKGGDQDFFIYKFNVNGDSLDAKYYNYSSVDLGFDILSYSSGYKAFSFPNQSPLTGSKVVNVDSNLNLLSTVDIDTFPPDINAFWGNITVKWLNDSIYLAYARIYDSGQTFPDYQGLGVLWITKDDSMMMSRVFGKNDTSDVECGKGMDFVYSSHILCRWSKQFCSG